MFSEDILIKIIEDKDARRVPFIYQSTMIRVIERVLNDTDNNEPRNNNNDNG